MRWRLPALTAVVCLDVEEPEPAPEPVDAESVRAVFDLVAERAVDRVTAGGFVSSVTGLPFSEAEVDEYRDRVLSLAEPWIGPDRRVLEIGVGSGLLMWEIAPRVAGLHGVLRCFAVSFGAVVALVAAGRELLLTGVEGGDRAGRLERPRLREHSPRTLDVAVAHQCRQ